MFVSLLGHDQDVLNAGREYGLIPDENRPLDDSDVGDNLTLVFDKDRPRGKRAVPSARLREDGDVDGKARAQGRANRGVLRWPDGRLSDNSRRYLHKSASP
jgi:hypothetical protein